MKWFNVSEIRTLDDLKKAYRRLAMAHHPDRGGNTQDMQEYLGIGRNKLFRLFQDPGFPAYRIGKDGPWLIRRRDLEKWLEELIRQPTKTHVFR